MCGIAGRFHPLTLPAAPGWSTPASARLAHSGPDGEGHWRDARCELVHRRLALIDLSPTGRQPMANEDGSVQVIFNGEIYNYRQLTAELKGRGHLFRGTSDTEVLVHLYEECGAELVSRLRGIFAFALYDGRAGRLLLARDRFGVKPLFYTVHDGQWVFASEMKAIAALPDFRAEIDRQACYDFLGLGYVPEPATGFSNIQALPHGAVLTVDAGRQELKRYDQVEARPDVGRGMSDAVAAVSNGLVAAVEGQSVADVPVAALLSAGTGLGRARHVRGGQPLRGVDPRLGAPGVQGDAAGACRARRFGDPPRRPVQLPVRGPEAGARDPPRPGRPPGRVSTLRRLPATGGVRPRGAVAACHGEPLCCEPALGHAPQGGHDEHAGEHRGAGADAGRGARRHGPHAAPPSEDRWAPGEARAPRARATVASPGGRAPSEARLHDTARRDGASGLPRGPAGPAACARRAHTWRPRQRPDRALARPVPGRSHRHGSPRWRYQSGRALPACVHSLVPRAVDAPVPADMVSRVEGGKAGS